MNISKVFRLLGLMVILFGLSITGRTSQATAIPQSFGSGLAICAAPIQPVVLQNPTTITNCAQAASRQP